MILSDLLNGLTRLTETAAEHEVNGLALDSRKVQAGNAFIALAGFQQHGLSHLQQALDNGAAAVLFDPQKGGADLLKNFSGHLKIPTIAINDLTKTLGLIAARFYGHPSHHLNVIGITGTNGKTSCSHFLGQLLDNCGVIGTLGWGSFGQLNKTANTTPDALALQAMLGELAKQHIQTVALEVSSQGLDQGRVNGISFTGALFTNISRDHLDYHLTMDAYLQAKLALFAKPELTFAVVNLDDPHSGSVVSAIPAHTEVWGISQTGRKPLKGESLLADMVTHQAEGISFRISWRDHTATVTLPLYGDYNIANALSVLAVALALSMPFTTAIARLAQLKTISGRMERFGETNQPSVFVDYAHTPDALDKALSSLRQHNGNTLWLVFGCGGNRDTGKRAEMGKIAEQWADHIIITDDNPRFENSEAIIADILAGCKMGKTQVIADRRQAIAHAISQAAATDYVLIAGKGHEDHQEINGVCHPFSDRDIVARCLASSYAHPAKATHCQAFNPMTPSQP